MRLPTKLAAMAGALCMLAGAGANAQAASPATVLQGVRIIDGQGGAPIENGSIVIRDGRIEAVQPQGATPPAGARLVDLRGKTVMPALIAGHAHLGITNGAKSGAAEITPANVTRQLQKYARYGVGTVAVFGTDHDFIYRMRADQRAGKLTLPTIVTAGHGFGVPHGAPPVAMGMDQVYRPTTIEAVRKDIEKLAARKPDLVKIWVDDFGDDKTKKMDPALYREVIREAHQRGLKVVAHVYYLEDAKRLARDGVDLFGHSVRDRPVDAELIALMKEKNIGYIPTLQLDEAFFVYADKPDWMQDRFFRDALDPGVEAWLASPAYKVKQVSKQDLATAKANVLALHKAGVRVGMGTDSGATIPRIQGFAEHRELELLTAAGLTPMQALQAATSGNAAILGIDGERGALVPGKQADLLVLDANPLDDIRNTRKIHALWLRGVPLEGLR
ncbi:amidohydrolase family protein [Telluria beijingensis]|uniref:amidohydrolase family protein n=1 Tax=Telluria beijingensis TaxID=3068633 RepID=UPI00279582DC|nr:amidohydrolase family protein [Massilia sp. REN29]